MADNTATAQQLERRYQQLASLRLPHETVWHDVFDYMAPERALGWYDTPIESAGTTAQNQRSRIYDSTAIDAISILKANIASWMTPDNSRWFSLDAGEEADEATAAWMDDASQFLWEHIVAAGFGAVAGECYGDAVPAGWCVLYTDEAKDAKGRAAGGFNFEQWPLHQCYVASTKPAGRVDVIYRVFQMTVEQAAIEYGLDKLSEKAQQLHANGKLSDRLEMLWGIEPRGEGQYGAKLTKNMMFRSCHMERATKHIVRESGYPEFPCAVPRWTMIPGTAYATGPGSVVLPDVKTLNDIKRMELMSLDVAVGGMWKAVDDGVLNPATVRIGPRKIVAMASLESMAPLETGANFNVSFSKCDQLQTGIRRALMADMLTPVGGPVRSATEIAQNMSQIRQLMAPLIGRFQSEFLQVIVERCFNIALRAGAIQAYVGPVPESLVQTGGQYQVRYISPLARSQKMEEVNAIDAYVAGQAQLMAATQDPTMMDGIKLDEASYEKGKALGVPVGLLRGPKELAAKREMDNKAREQAQQQAQQQEVQQHAATSAVDAMAAA